MVQVGSGLVQVWFRFGSGLVQVGSGPGRDAKNCQIAWEVLQKQLLVQVWFWFGSGLVLMAQVWFRFGFDIQV